MAADATDPLVGSMLGKDYRVLEPIGIGGMAVVYLVEHQTLLKRFAAKVLSPALASSLEARARFTQEAHAASQLDHENIVSITDFGVTLDHRPFFVMELLRGQTLDQRIAEGPMTIEEVVAVSVPVARALAHAHAEGIVHLDVKPENIFLVQRSQGRWGVKVVDFGIAKTPHSPGLTKLGETAGSPLFMAPETCRGDDQIDLRADVYSFGILLYLMLCGRVPFLDDDMDRVLAMQLVEPPRPPRELNPELTPELAAVVERALAKQPADRYPSMPALMRELEAALPPGSDRLLIEAASGVTMGDTPFAGALSGMDSMRMARASQTQPILPMAPERRRWPIVLGTLAAAAAAAVVGVLVWRMVDPAAASAPRVAQARSAALPAHVDGEPARVEPARARPDVEPVSPPPAVEPAPAAVEPAPAVEPATPGEPATATPAGEPVSDATTQDSAASEARALGARPAPRAQAARVATLAKPASAPTATPSKPASASPATPTRPSGAVAAGVTAPVTGSAEPSTAPTGRAATGIPPTALAPTATPPALAAAAPPPATPPPATAATPPPPATPPPATAATPPPPAVPASEPAVTLPPPAPPVTLPPPPPPRGSLDATPAVISLDVKGSLSPQIVRRSVERTLSALRACYRVAARAGGATPAVELRLAFEIDENSLATHVATSGASFGSLASCAAGVAGQIRTQEAPDVGTAQVSVVIGFRPS